MFLLSKLWWIAMEGNENWIKNSKVRINSHFSFCCELSENSDFKKYSDNLKNSDKKNFSKLSNNSQNQAIKNFQKIQNQNFQTVLNIQGRYMRVSAGAPPRDLKRRVFRIFAQFRIFRQFAAANWIFWKFPIFWIV